MGRSSAFFDGVRKKCGECGNIKLIATDFIRSGNVSENPAQSSYWHSQCNDCRVEKIKLRKREKAANTKVILHVFYQRRLMHEQAMKYLIINSPTKIINRDFYELDMTHTKIRSVLYADSYTLRGWIADQVIFMDQRPDQDAVTAAIMRVQARCGKVFFREELIYSCEDKK